MKQMEPLKALSKQELNELIRWVSDESAVIPAEQRARLKRILAVYSRLTEGRDPSAKQVLVLLRQAMGILPKSERGGMSGDQDSGEKAQAAEPLAVPQLDEAWDPAQQEQYDELVKKRREAGQKKREYDQKVRAFRASKRKVSSQIEFELGKPNEMLFSFPMAEREDKRNQIRSVDRMTEFDKTKGLHMSNDYPKRMDLKVIATEIQYKVETVTDPETGKSVRASMRADGPDGFQLTWGAVGNLIKMHVGFAIPINRMSLMIGQPEFSSSKICRALQYVASNLVGIYLHLGEQFSDLGFIAGDDTPAKVLDTSETGEPDAICDEIDAQLGWIQPLAGGQGDKKALNVSLIIGKTEADPRSTIRFFRTHAGSVGNLLTRILECRNPKVGPVIFQGDLSSTNLPSPEIRAIVEFITAGCGAHARRPFWRYREKDESLCYFMLKGFLYLSDIEARIDERGRTRENVLRFRGRHGRRIWLAMRDRCIAAVTGVVSGPGIYPDGITPNIWPPGTDMHKAANYIINHFDELTLYLEHPELAYTNNGSERAHRIEKCMTSSSKFRKTKRGRVALDILRTINATCTAAGVDLTNYLVFVFTHIDETHDHPESFTPFAFAQSLDQKIAKTPAAVTTIHLN